MSAVETLRVVQSGLVAASIVVLVAAAGFTLYRLAKGPTSLDRIIASDLIVGIAVGAFALQMVTSSLVTTLPIMLALSLVGFIGAVSMARFVHDQVPGSPDEVRRARRRAEGRRAVVRGERRDGPEHGTPGVAGGQVGPPAPPRVQDPPGGPR